MIPGSVIASWIALIGLGLGPGLQGGDNPVPVWYLILAGLFIARPILFPIVFKREYADAEADVGRVRRSPVTSRITFMLLAVGGAVPFVSRQGDSEGLLEPLVSAPSFWLAVGISLVHCIVSPVVWPLARWRSRFRQGTADR
ncbi:hypothetical protein ACFVAF_20225 [Streptomyces sp. NPDC057596]|uniref:hypothetical protein n=1 Tax=Streptomyces sp. NPDC057596 TaxID=3346178 RepID=UPI00368307EE